MKKIVWAILLIGLVVFFTALPREKSLNKIRIGAPDDVSGLIVHYLLNSKGLQGETVIQNFTVLGVKDCCGSNTQWALSSEELDIAIMCPDAATMLLEKDSRYVVVSPILANSDVIVVKNGVFPQLVGIAQNRDYQAQLVHDTFGPKCVPVNMHAASLPYAFEKSAVEGVVVDILKSFALQGSKLPSFYRETDRVTAVLVVRKAFMDDVRYKDFLRLYDQGVNELSQPDVMRAELKKFKSIELSEEDMQIWKQLKIKFLFVRPET
ncbi:MAG: putative rane protein [Firmicutes bacterium]|nr:putative rane protein [Bacillota bacterium]